MAHFKDVVNKIASEKGISFGGESAKKLNGIQRQFEQKELDLDQAIEQMNYWIDNIRLGFDKKDYERIKKEMK